MMEFLARKVKRVKWALQPFMDSAGVGADVARTCLGTRDNKLSLWACGADEASVTDVALAMAASADRPEKMDIAWAPRGQFRDAGIELVDSEGRTPVASLRNRHVDATELTVSKLATIAEVLAPSARGDACRTFTKSEITTLLTLAVREGRVALDELLEGCRREVRKRL